MTNSVESIANSPILNCLVPKWLPLHPTGTMAARGGSLGEGDIHPLPLDKGPTVALLKSALALLLAQT